MKTTFLILAALTCSIVSCSESVKSDQQNESPTSETNQTEQESSSTNTKKLAAINDENRQAEGAVECITQQYALVKDGKFKEALNYYSSKIRAKVEAQIAENPEITKDWQAATNRSEKEFQEVLKAVRENPDSFVFEEGMWRMNQR